MLDHYHQHPKRERGRKERKGEREREKRKEGREREEGDSKGIKNKANISMGSWMNLIVCVYMYVNTC